MSCDSKVKRNPSCVFVSGPSNSGKTTLIEQLIPKLRKKGIRVGTIKHAHEGFEMDHPGKDSWRHAEAGASAVTVIAPHQAALLVRTENMMPLAQAVDQMAPYADLILIEGYKEYNGPRILLREATSRAINVEGEVCRIGVRVDRLSTVELDQAIAFLLEHVHTYEKDASVNISGGGVS